MVVFVLLSMLAATVGLVNLLTWPRARRASPADAASQGRLGRVSILIPARNEAANIEACVRAAAVLKPHEIVVCDDGSTDATPSVLTRLLKELPHLRVIQGGGDLPAAWLGKPWACERLSRAATGDSLLFVDADVVVDASALTALATLVAAWDADVVTAVPRQRMVTWFEQLVLPLLLLTYVSWLPLPLIWRTRDERLLAANGQFLWLRQQTLEGVGGFAAVRSEVVDDMALCRLAKRARLTVLFADGFEVATCRMYRSASEVIDGFSKNLHEGVGSVVGVFVVIGLYVGAFVAPAVSLLIAPSPAGALGVALALTMRLALAWRFRQPVWSALLFPLGALAFVLIALNSLLWSQRSAIRWKGRTYRNRAERSECSESSEPSEGEDVGAGARESVLL